MFRMILIHSILKLSREPFYTCLCIYMHRACMRRWSSCVHIHVHQFIMNTCLSMHTHASPCIRMLVLKNLIFCPVWFFFPAYFLYPIMILMLLFNLFCRSYCLSRVGVVLAIFPHGTRPWPRIQRPWYTQPASNLSFFCFQRVLLVAFWCRH